MSARCVRGSGVNLFTMREVDEMGMRNVMERAINVASQGHGGFYRVLRHGRGRS